MLDVINRGALAPILNKQLPAIVSYTVSLAMEKFADHIKAFDVTRQKIINKYATLDDEGNPKVDDKGAVEFAEGQQEKCVAEINEIAEIEIDLGEDKAVVDLAMLPELTVSEMSLLRLFIEAK